MSDPALTAGRAGVDPLLFDAIPGLRADLDAPDLAAALPSDHPAWQRDVLSLSMRARAILATLRPLAIKVLGFWDHRLREIAIGGRDLAIEPSGCYRLR